MQNTALVVEDDPAIRIVLATNLRSEGHRVIEAVSAEEGLLIMQDEKPDIVLVDLRLPGLHGFDLIRTLRATSDVPIIIVTANTNSPDVVAGLEAGADDYVMKPFVAKELMARVRRQLHRRASESPIVQRLTCGDLTLDADTFQLRKNDTPISVTRIEYDVLFELMAAEGRVLSREHLLTSVWGYANAGDGRVVDNLMYRLRNKIEDDPSAPRKLLTIRGFGYRLVPG
jgi:DNA-binding response OmpR family regulator